MRLFFALFVWSFGLVRGEDIKMVNLPMPLEQLPQNFPVNVAGRIMGSDISQIPLSGQSLLDRSAVLSIIDADCASGAVLPPKGRYQFLIRFKTIDRIEKLVIAGTLKGATINVRLSELPIAPQEEGWQSVVENKSLGFPVTSFSFRPRAALQALVTIRTGSEWDGFPPAIYDISLYSAEHDLREFKLQPVATSSPAPETSHPSPSAGKKTSPTEPSALNTVNLGSIYARTHVLEVSPLSNVESANHINDDNLDTYLEFEPKARESVVVLEMEQSRKIRKISALHSKQPGELIVYAANELPTMAFRGKRQPIQLAWLSPTSGAETFSDMPLLAQLQTDRTSIQPRLLQVDPSWFNSLTQLGSMPTDKQAFSNIEASAEDCRYIVLRFLNKSKEPSVGFRIYDVNVFGDYPPNTFTLVRQAIPEAKLDPLITVKQTASPLSTDQTPEDFSRVGTQSPGAASPSRPQ